LPVAVGAWPACHVADVPTAVWNGNWKVLTAVWGSGRFLPTFETATGIQPPFQTTVRGYFSMLNLTIYFRKIEEN
jgi:hypothetical protein